MGVVAASPRSKVNTSTQADEMARYLNASSIWDQTKRLVQLSLNSYGQPARRRLPRPASLIYYTRGARRWLHLSFELEGVLDTTAISTDSMLHATASRLCRSAPRSQAPGPRPDASAVPCGALQIDFAPNVLLNIVCCNANLLHRTPAPLDTAAHV